MPRVLEERAPRKSALGKAECWPNRDQAFSCIVAIAMSKLLTIGECSYPTLDVVMIQSYRPQVCNGRMHGYGSEEGQKN